MSDQACQSAVPEKPLPWRVRAWRRVCVEVRWQVRSLWNRTGYRPFSRFIHRFGFHHMEANTHIDPTGTLHWCHWCGLRAFEKHWRGSDLA